MTTRIVAGLLGPGKARSQEKPEHGHMAIALGSTPSSVLWQQGPEDIFETLA